MIEREFNLSTGASPPAPSSRPAQQPARPAARRGASGRGGNKSNRYGRTGRQRRRAIVIRRVSLLLVIVALFGALAVFAFRFALELIDKLSVPTYQPVTYDISGYRYDPADPYMVIVNANLPLADGYTVETAQADPATGMVLESAAAAAYQQMASAALSQGVELTLTAGYRDSAAQQELYNARYKSYRKKGLSEAEAAANTATIVARPGCSEYATGLLADILTPDHGRQDTGFANTAAYAWLCRYAPEYGFVLRYPENSQPITGMVYQPWCWRYVGVENAKAVTQSGVSMEEFAALQLAAQG